MKRLSRILVLIYLITLVAVPGLPADAAGASIDTPDSIGYLQTYPVKINGAVSGADYIFISGLQLSPDSKTAFRQGRYFINNNIPEHGYFIPYKGGTVDLTGYTTTAEEKSKEETIYVTYIGTSKSGKLSHGLDFGDKVEWFSSIKTLGTVKKTHSINPLFLSLNTPAGYDVTMTGAEPFIRRADLMMRSKSVENQYESLTIDVSTYGLNDFRNTFDKDTADGYSWSPSTLEKVDQGVIDAMKGKEGWVRKKVEKSLYGVPDGQEPNGYFTMNLTSRVLKSGYAIQMSYSCRGYGLASALDGMATNAYNDFLNMAKSLAIVPKVGSDKNYPVTGEIKETKEGGTYTLSLNALEKTVFNNGVFNTGNKNKDSDFLVLVNAVSADGGAVEKGMTITGKIIEGDQAPIGFKTGTAKLASTIKEKISGGQATFEVMTKGSRGPGGGLKYNPDQKIEFTMTDSNGKVVSNQAVYTVKLMDASPKLVIDKAMPQIQAGYDGAFSFKLTDPDSKKLKYTVETSMSYIRGAGKKSTWVRQLKGECKPGDTVSVAFQAPQVGNFDLQGQMDDLSMWAMQQDTVWALGVDTIGIGLDKAKTGAEKSLSSAEIAKRLKDLSEYKDVKEKYVTLSELLAAQQKFEKWKLVNNAFTAYGMFDFTKGAIIGVNGDFPKQALNADSGASGIGEKIADTGVFFISVVQTTAGAVTMVTSKIPIVGELNGQTMRAFNLATNVWKGDLMYISKVDKINRAQEKFLPVGVKITITDDTGYEVKAMTSFKVAYFWLE